MKQTEISNELLYTRGIILAEATHAFTTLALMGHRHHKLIDYGSYLSVDAFDDSEEEQQTTIAVLRNTTRSTWEMTASKGVSESGPYWYTEFRYVFE